MRGNIKSTERRTRSNTRCKMRGCAKLALVGEGGLCAQHLTNMQQSISSTKHQAQINAHLDMSLDEGINVLGDIGMVVLGFDEHGFFIPERGK